LLKVRRIKGDAVFGDYVEMRQLYTHLQCTCSARGLSQLASYANYHAKRNTLPNVIGIHHTSRSGVRREAGESTCCNLQCRIGRLQRPGGGHGVARRNARNDLPRGQGRRSTLNGPPLNMAFVSIKAMRTTSFNTKTQDVADAYYTYR
jgi:hypothetical protein